MDFTVYDRVEDKLTVAEAKEILGKISKYYLLNLNYRLTKH